MTISKLGIKQYEYFVANIFSANKCNFGLKNVINNLLIKIV